MFFVLHMYLSDEGFECVTIRYSLLRDLLETSLSLLNK